MNSPKISAILKGIIKGLISHQSDVLDGPKISYDNKGTGYHNKHHPSILNSIYDNVMDSIEDLESDGDDVTNLEKPKITYGSDTKIN